MSNYDPNRKTRKPLDCQEETIAYMNCIKAQGFDDTKECSQHITALMECQKAAAQRMRQTNTLKYHMTRLGSKMKHIPK